MHGENTCVPKVADMSTVPDLRNWTRGTNSFMHAGPVNGIFEEADRTHIHVPGMRKLHIYMLIAQV